MFFNSSPDVLSQDASHVLEIFAPFPSLVVDSLRRLSCTPLPPSSLSLNPSRSY